MTDHKDLMADAIIEVTAFFLKEADRFNYEALEDLLWAKPLDGNRKVIERPSEGPLTFDDSESITDNVGFQFHIIDQGTGDTCSGIQYEVDFCGVDDTFGGFLPQLTIIAEERLRMETELRTPNTLTEAISTASIDPTSAMNRRTVRFITVWGYKGYKHGGSDMDILGVLDLRSKGLRGILAPIPQLPKLKMKGR